MKNKNEEVTESGGLQRACRAGAMILLVGFWFDGGLFKLPTAVVFWMLLELSRMELGGDVQEGPAPGAGTVVMKGVQAKTSLRSFWRKFGRRGSAAPPSETRGRSRYEGMLRWLAVVLAMLATAETALHVFPPHFAVSEGTLSLARRFLVEPKERADFEALAGQPIWQGQKLGVFLEQVELANYNRELINWQLNDRIYRDFVLSPAIKPATNLDWRRPLWEEFYPRIRHESSTADAAQIVVRHLRERVTIADIPNPPREVSLIWRRQITDKVGFEIIYVAALRSVGVPARLNSEQQAEFFNGTQWQDAPRPIIESFSDPTNDEK